MEEWGRFAEEIGVDLYEVIDAIRVRPTHSNMRTPGFGVGGYCLTKDPLFGELAAREIFHHDHLRFPYSTRSVEVNNAMPLVSLDKVQTLLGGSICDKTILLLGVSYRNDVADTRCSPSQIFAEEALRRGARVIFHDSLISYWPEMNTKVSREIPSLKGVDAVVFAVGHRSYQAIDLEQWIGRNRPLFFDANNVLSREQRERIHALGCAVHCIGRGEGL
jgi:UDP-N-acetyl-D-mannosaminuronate dehydrogenase